MRSPLAAGCCTISTAFPTVLHYTLAAGPGMQGPAATRA